MSLYIPPSSLLSTLKDEKINSINKRFENTPLRIGVVTEVYDIDNEKNLSKTVPEYTVVTKETENGAGIKYKTYGNCLYLDKFGGIADFFEHKIRPTVIKIDNEPTKVSHDFKKQNGSLVLLLCLDGFSENAIIIGGIPNVQNTETQRKTTLTKDAGHHMEGEFNGINWKVNKDGEFVLTFKSPTDNDGKVIDKKYSGTFSKIDKTGSFEVKDQHNHVRMDNDKGGFNLKTDADYKLEADKNIETTAKKDILEKAANWAAEYSGSAKQKSASWEVEVSGKATIKASGAVNIETNSMDIKSKQVTVQSNAVFLGAAGGAPALVLATKFVGTGNGGAPVISMAIGPFSSKVFIT